MFYCITVFGRLAFIKMFLSVSLSQVNFLICQTTALVYSILFKSYLSPRRVSPTTRHVAQVALGILLACVSFGW